MLDAMDFRAREDNDILGLAQDAMRPLRATNGRLGAFRQDDEEIEVDVVGRYSPSVGTQKVNLFGPELLYKAFTGFVHKLLGNAFIKG
jgi:hypothetical protein